MDTAGWFQIWLIGRGYFFKAQNTKNENKNMTGIKRRSEAQVFTVLNVMWPHLASTPAKKTDAVRRMLNRGKQEVLSL